MISYSKDNRKLSDAVLMGPEVVDLDVGLSQFTFVVNVKTLLFVGDSGT